MRHGIDKDRNKLIYRTVPRVAYVLVIYVVGRGTVVGKMTNVEYEDEDGR